MPDKLIFAQTFEGLFRALGDKLDAPLVAELRTLGVDPTTELKPAYPLDVFLQVVRRVGQTLAPGAPEAEQSELAGRRFILGYGHTMVGRAMLGMMRVIGPRRTLERLSRQFRTGNNFSETTLKELSPGAFELWVNQCKNPGWYRGIIAAGLEHAGARDVSVEVVRHGEEGGTFHVRWR